MPERFKVTRAEEPELDAVHGKLLPTYAEIERKGMSNLYYVYHYAFAIIHSNSIRWMSYT